MITTVCMNPSFDKTATVDRLAVGDVNRLDEVHSYAGGKGINVAVVLKRLGVETACLGCLGEENKASFLQILEKEDIAFDYITLPGEIRTNLKILDKEDRVVTEFNEAGPEMSQEKEAQFLSLLRGKAAKSEYVVFSGRLPVGCSDDTYQQCMRELPDTRCVLDATGDALLLGVKEKPFLIKPNLPELEGVVGCQLRTLRAIRDAALMLMAKGAQNVVVSMGKFGALFTDGKSTLFAPALVVEAKSTVGAGDAMLGGILLGLNKGQALKDSFRYGVAAGAASVMTDGTQLLHPSDFESLLPKVLLQEV